MASLPQPDDDDDDDDDGNEITDGGEDEEYAGTPAVTPPSHDDQSPPVITLSQGQSPGPATSPVPPSPSQDFPLDIMNHDGLLTENTELSASEAPQE